MIRRKTGIHINSKRPRSVEKKKNNERTFNNELM